MTSALAPEDGTAHRAAIEALRSARRVLVARADDLGDHVLASGFPAALAECVPGECGFLGNPAALALMDASPLAFAAGVDCRPQNRRDVLRAGRQMRSEVDRFDPDVVVLPRFGFEREALGIALVGSRARTVVTWERHATAKRARRSWWLPLLPGPRLYRAGAPVHEHDRLATFARFAGVDPGELAPRLSPSLRDEPAGVEGVAGWHRPIVTLGVGAAQARRWWPAERFAALVDRLAAEGATCVLLGSPPEAGRAAELVRQLTPGVRVVDLVGRLPLRTTAQVIASSALYVGNDSGVGHISAALGVPTVTISCHPAGAPSDHVNAPDRYHPIGAANRVVRPARARRPECAGGCVPVDEPCCITLVAVDEVADACFELLAPMARGAREGSPT